MAQMESVWEEESIMVQSSCCSGKKKEKMEVNETMGEWRVADKGGNFVKEEEVTTTGQRNEE